DDDAQCELHHVLMNVAGLAVLPMGQHLLGVAGHDPAIRSDALTVKCGLGEAPLTKPGIALIGEQSVAKEPAAVLDEAVFEDVLVISDERCLNQIRMIEKVNVKPGGTVIEDVAVFARPTGEDRKGIGTGEGHVADQEMRFGTGRTFHRKSASSSVPSLA